MQPTFRRLFPIAGIVAAMAGAAPLDSLAEASSKSASDAWQLTASGLFADAHDIFSARRTALQSDRDTRLGQALTLLQLQPKTDARVRQSAALLDALLTENSTDEIGVNARYFRARLEHLHRYPPDPASAIPHYKQLLAEHPAHPLAGQALVKLALIQLYRPIPSDERARAFASFTAQAPAVSSAAARRDLHLVLGEAALRLDLGQQAALDHFVAALEAGIQLRPVRADTLVRIGELASVLGQPELARRHYQLFLDGFQRDPRRLTVAQHLAALDTPVVR